MEYIVKQVQSAKKYKQIWQNENSKVSNDTNKIIFIKDSKNFISMVMQIRNYESRDLEQKLGS